MAKAIDDDNYAIMASLDLRAAFDVVNLILLLPWVMFATMPMKTALFRTTELPQSTKEVGDAPFWVQRHMQGPNSPLPES